MNHVEGKQHAWRAKDGSSLIRLKELGRQTKAGWVVTAILILLATSPELVRSAMYLNLASIQIAHQAVTPRDTARKAPGAPHTGDLTRAVQLARHSLKLNPAGTARRQVGRALYLNGQYAAAQATFRRSAERDPRSIAAQIGLAQTHEALGERERAMAMWRALGAPAQLAAQGETLLEQGAWQAAIEAYRAAIEVAPGYEDAYYPLGWTLYKHMGRFEEALEIFHTAQKSVPNSPWPYVNSGDLYMDRGQVQHAIRWYAQALNVAPGEPNLDTKLAWAYVTAGNQMLEAGQLEEAEAAYQSALEVVPAYAEAYQGLARLAWEGRGERPAALAALQRAIALAPANFRSYLLMGDIVGQKDPVAAERWYQQAESVLRETSDASSAEFHAHLGLVYDHQGRYADAITELQAAIQLEPDNPWYHNSLGDAYLRSQETEKARQAYRLAIEIDPSNTHAREQLTTLSSSSDS